MSLAAEDLMEKQVEIVYSEQQLAGAELSEKVVDALKTIFDPEIPVNIYDLGLIYKVTVNDDSSVDIVMTLTAPGCPVAQTFPGTIENAIKAVDGIKDVAVELTWEPPWSQDRMSEEARLELGFL